MSVIPNILSLSSSYSPASLYVSLRTGGSFYDHSYCHPSSGLVDILLKAREFVSPDDLDYVAVDIGPGGFTSTRVAVSLSMGIASAANIPIIPIKSTEALAVKAFTEKNVSHSIVSLLLKPGLVLLSSYELTSGSINECFPPVIMDQDEFDTWVRDRDFYGSALYGTGFTLICDSNAEFNTEHHTARDIYSAAMVCLHAPKRVLNPTDVSVDYAILPSAMMLHEQNLLNKVKI
ncbi:MULTISPECIES: hypothetical protein [Candidatus Ichthyocystis]|uniref:hypothetical protein n=1 Tax=Candidatus Ichthyocystis TaxID=2929841 RepID=UPI000B811540|nr:MULTISPECIES: hypothetical protein [Ichthyocystis]